MVALGRYQVKVFGVDCSCGSSSKGVPIVKLPQQFTIKSLELFVQEVYNFKMLLGHYALNHCGTNSNEFGLTMVPLVFSSCFEICKDHLEYLPSINMELG